MEKSNEKKKKTAIVIAAVLALVATALGGTLAYQDYNQHKSNELIGDSIKYEARLVEDFAEVNDWKVSDDPITKKISVANLGQAPEYGEVYIRLQLKEYMEIGALSYNETSKRYMIDTKGEFVIFATESEAVTATSAGGQYAGHLFAELTDIVTGKHGFFIETKDHDPNGQMGKYVITGYTVGDAVAVIGSGPQVKAATTNHHEFPSDECEYAIHSWKTNSDLETREYIEWQLNTGAIITLAEWLDPNGAYKGMPVDKWVVDTANDEGWVYWGRSLDPGDDTELLMESVKLIKQPEGSFYYVIHTDMQAVSFDELVTGNVDWGDAGDNFVKNIPKLAFNGPTPATVPEGETVASPGVISTPNDVDPSDLVWTSSDTSLATVDQNGVVTGVKAGGPVTITVKAPNGAKAFYTITVVPTDSGEVPATGVSINGGDIDMSVGEEKNVTCTLTPPGATGTPAWASSDPTIATIDSTGKITAVGEGTATITVTVNGHTDSITVTVTDPGEDTTLPTIDVGNNGYTPKRDVDDPMNGDGLFTKKFFPDLTNPNNNVHYHDGAIHLEDIIADGTYTGVTATALDEDYADFITIGLDHHNKPSLIYSYIPSNDEWIAWILEYGGDDLFINTTVLLTRDDGKSAIITINMYYWDSSITMDF